MYQDHRLLVSENAALGSEPEHGPWSPEWSDKMKTATLSLFGRDLIGFLF
jgi:hypothetical protein